jgi:predicted AAA+ superfamily ATPase
LKKKWEYKSLFFDKIGNMIPRSIKPLKKQSFFLFGPRGTGKSTWVKAAYPEAFRVDLLNEAVFQEYLRDPSAFEKELKAQQSQIVLVDEIQRLPGLLNDVHRIMEDEKKYQFILTGSSARKLRKAGTNLLAGRAWTRKLFPFTAVELQERFNLRSSLTFGHLPEVFFSSDPKMYLKSYVGTYLREEIQQEALIRNLAAFARFLESAALSQASVLNIQTIARDCGVDRKTIDAYFNLLEDLMIGFRLPVFQKRSKRKIITHPKFYYFDVGVYRTLRRMGPLDDPNEIDGASVETLVFQEIRATLSNLELDDELSFYRNHDQVEVDFVLYGDSGFTAIEVKKSDRFRDSDLDSLKKFLEEFPKARGFLFYSGSKRMLVDGIQVIPLTEALLSLPDIILGRASF